MLKTLEAVRPLTLTEMQEARRRITGSIVRTPLVRLDLGPKFPDIRLKLENLQATNSYKLRGAVNAVGMLTEDERKLGVWTISAGNAGQGVAYAARQAGVPCTVVAIETAPTAKIERMRALGATLVLVSYEAAWRALGERSYPGSAERLCIRSTIRTSSRAIAPWASRFSKMHRIPWPSLPPSAAAASSQAWAARSGH